MSNEEWLQMSSLKNKKYNNSSWIPLKGAEIISKGEANQLEFTEELIFFNSVLIKMSDINEVSKISWDCLNGRYSFGYVENNKYISSDSILNLDEKEIGITPVLDQMILRKNFKKWYLHQDIILTLGLEKEGNNWVDPNYNYEIVVKEKKDSSGKTVLIEIKSDYLKDYLCARNMFLYLMSFFQRSEISLKKVKEENEKTQNYEFEKSGIKNNFLGDILVQTVTRTDLNEDEDIPDLSILDNNNNIKVENKIINNSQEKNSKEYYNYGKLWKNECIFPSKSSPRVRGDHIEEYLPFKIDNMGNSLSGKDLRNSGKWLWFEPEVVKDVLSLRDSSLKFYSQYTGNLTCSYGYDIHFGINPIGKINIFSEDIATLPIWIQKIFLSKNIVPDGGVSKELLSSQVKCEPANTQSYENLFKKYHFLLNELTKTKFSFSFFKEELISQLSFDNINRFRVSNISDAYSLAKDISKITVEIINAKEIKKFFNITEDLKSLKLVEKVLEKIIGEKDSKAKMCPIFAIYDLRNFDAHVKTNRNDIENAFERLGININEIPVIIGENIIKNAYFWVYNVGYIFSIYKEKNK